MILSIIIVEYNCLEALKKCLRSITENVEKIDYEIIILCNSDYDEVLEEKLLKEFPFAKWIFNRKNLGYAKAVNIGINRSSGKYIFIINPDAQLIDKNISLAVRYLEKSPDIAILGPKIIDEDGKIQDSRRSFITPYMFTSRVISRLFRKISGEILDNKDYNSIQTTDWVSGACMLIKKSGIEKAGLMDERYFMYVEDMDWCKRFWDNGFKVIYWPNMIIQHNASRIGSEGISIGCINKYAWIHFVSYVKFFCKYFPQSLWLHTKNA